MGSLEIEIMNAIWKMFEENDDTNVSISDVVEHLESCDIHRAYTTIKTVMDRLVSKGVLARYKVKRKYYYNATINRFEATKLSIEKVSEQFFEGNFQEMISFMEENYSSLVTA